MSSAVRARTRTASCPGASPRISRARWSTKEASWRTQSAPASLRIGYFCPRISMSTRCFSAMAPLQRLRLLNIEPVQLLDDAVHLGQHLLALLPQARQLRAVGL